MIAPFVPETSYADFPGSPICIWSALTTLREGETSCLVLTSKRYRLKAEFVEPRR
jgi:hypothetical protein